MNHVMRAPAMSSPPASSLTSRAATALFHSTTVLDRRWGSRWKPVGQYRCSTRRFNDYTKRSRRMAAKQILLHNVSMYAEYLFQSWKKDDYDDGKGMWSNSSWYKHQPWSRAIKRKGFDPRASRWDTYRNRRTEKFEFCGDDEEIEEIFHLSFRGKRGFYWSFSDDESFHWSYSSRCEDWKKFSHKEYNSEYEDDTPSTTILAAERIALGLSASGPLKLEEVKKAYIECALRWHPDRHHGSSKVEAEEKFKNCSAAYEALCEKMA